MNRRLLIALLAVVGLSLYLGRGGDDELLAAPRGGHESKEGRESREGHEGRESTHANRPDANPAKPGRGGTRPAASDKLDPLLAADLQDGVSRWRARAHGAHDAQPGALSPIAAPPRLASAWDPALPPPPPPPPVVRQEAPPPPPPPMAPPFPHAWVGRFNDEGPPSAPGVKDMASSASSASSASAPPAAGGAASAASLAPVVRAIVSGPQQTWVVRAGDVIEGQWRIDRIQDRTMRLTYLPLQQQQTIVMK